MGQIEKPCVICGSSCAGQPRIKNAQGQYAHQTCVEQAKKRNASKPHSPTQQDAGSMAALLSDIDDEDMIGGAHSCQGCGYPMDDEAAICLHCGFNRETGRRFNTKVARDPNKPTITGKGAKIGGLALRPFLPIIGAAVGGTLGAVIWGLIVYATGFEIGYAAIGVGALCGLGACFGGEPESTGGGALAGMLAALVAVCAIAGGKYLALDMTYRKVMKETKAEENLASAFVVDMATARTRFAYQTGRELINDGMEVDWGGPLAFVEAAYWPDDYPDDFQQMVLDKWKSLTGGQQQAWRAHVAEVANTAYAKEFGDDLGDDAYTPDDIDEDWALDEMARTAAETVVTSGETIDWPDKSIPLSMVEWPDEFPEQLRDAVDERWDALGDSGQLDYQRDAEREMADMERSARELADSFAGEIKKTALIDSFKHPVQALFLLLAIATAYGIPANND